MKIAVSGKGGVGKTTISASLVRCLANRGYTVYAIDADPDASLGIALGLDMEKLDKLAPLIEMKEVISAKSAGGGAFIDLNPEVDDVIQEYSIREGNIRFLRMGGIKQGGSACYCKENSFLNSVLNSLLFDKEEMVVLDMSAGIEHLTRGTAQGVDLLLIVSEPTRLSVKTARVVKQLASELGIQNVKVLGNKVRKEAEAAFLKKNFNPDEILEIIPFDEDLVERSMEEGAGGGTEPLIPHLEGVCQQVLKGVAN